MKRNIIFIDRDGVINRDSPDYIKSWDEFEFLPGALEAIARLCRSGFELILVTNQSIINRGMASRETLADIFIRMTAAIETAGGRLLDIYFCPHRPDENCRCRKPLPGMILSARQKHNIELPAACMIGDSAKDIFCGKNAGCGTTILVQTGNGPIARKELSETNTRPDFIARDLPDAARWICTR